MKKFKRTPNLSPKPTTKLAKAWLTNWRYNCDKKPGKSVRSNEHLSSSANTFNSQPAHPFSKWPPNACSLTRAWTSLNNSNLTSISTRVTSKLLKLFNPFTNLINSIRNSTPWSFCKGPCWIGLTLILKKPGTMLSREPNILKKLKNTKKKALIVPSGLCFSF